MEDQELYRKAKRRVRAKMGFFVHLAFYVGVNILLIIINLTVSPQYLWFKWPLMGWSIGLFFHALSVFVFTGQTLQKIEEKMIEEEMKKHRK
jgi:2TM domain